MLKVTAPTSRVEASARAAGRFVRGEHLIVAASGGPDSTALVLALHAVASDLEIELTVATLDHGLRPAPQTVGDIDFVRQLCGRLRLPFVTANRDVEHLAAKLGQGREAAARRARYAWLARVAAETGASAVATAHTLDDLAETVLMRLITGTGLDGLKAMTPSAAWPLDAAEIARLEGIIGLEVPPASTTGPRSVAWPPRLIRPLLDAARTDIQAYLISQGVEARHDPTNEDPAYLRNRIRREVMPLLAGMNPQFRSALARLAASAADDRAILEKAVDEAWERVVITASDQIHRDRAAEVALTTETTNEARHGPPVVIFNRAAYRQLAVGLQRRILRRAVRMLGGDTRAWGWARLEEAREWALGGRTGGLMTLPGEMWLLVERAELTLTRGQRPQRMTGDHTE